MAISLVWFRHKKLNEYFKEEIFYVFTFTVANWSFDLEKILLERTSHWLDRKQPKYDVEWYDFIKKNQNVYNYREIEKYCCQIVANKTLDLILDII